MKPGLTWNSMSTRFQSRAHRIGLHVMDHAQQRFIRAYRSRSIRTLIERSSSNNSARQVPALGMHDGEAMHETRQFVCDWPDYEMPMIRHDAEGNQASGHALESCGD